MKTDPDNRIYQHVESSPVLQQKICTLILNIHDLRIIFVIQATIINKSLERKFRENKLLFLNFILNIHK